LITSGTFTAQITTGVIATAAASVGLSFADTRSVSFYLQWAAPALTAGQGLMLMTTLTGALTIDVEVP
jgi:succinylarginine dihydrolase